MGFEDVFVQTPCPRCDYMLDVQLADVRLQRRVYCPACKVAIQLVDQHASVSTGLDQVESAMNDLIRKFGGSR